MSNLWPERAVTQGGWSRPTLSIGRQVRVEE